ncbi:hypothetical protein GV764_09195 [Atlantibacter hermannii]|nr:hypothetical protein [Atlantibacter hermannii]NBC99191.1 hypothetical protein [Atlantibacter hermannii]
MSHYAIILDQQRFSCFYHTPQGWEVYPLKGEESLECAQPAQLAEALRELNEHLVWSPAEQIVVLYQAPYQPWLPPLLDAVANSPVMVLPLAPWLACAAACDPLSKTPELFCRHLLPLLWKQLVEHDAPVKSHQLEAASRTQETLVQQLQQEQQENLALQEALKTCQQSLQQQQANWNKERAHYEANLLRTDDLTDAAIAQFMPLFFAHFWQKVSPSDMAMLLGSLTLPAISSPWPEPNKSALAIKKRSFQQSPFRHQQQIKAMARKFVEVGYLTVRPEMEPLLEEYES